MGAYFVQVKMEETTAVKIEAEDVQASGSEPLSSREIELLEKSRKFAMPGPVNSKKRNWSVEHGKDPVIDHIKTYHKRKLRAELAALVREHRWKEASLVVGGPGGLFDAQTVQDDLEHHTLADFWVAMEVLRREDDGERDEEVSVSIKKMFRQMLRRKFSPKVLASVHLELGMYLMSQKDYDGCYNELRAVIDVPPYRDDPLMNYWYGLNLHHLWYKKVSEDVKKYATATTIESGAGRASSQTEGVGETDDIDYLLNDESRSAQVEDIADLADAQHIHDIQDIKPFDMPPFGSVRQARLYQDDMQDGDEAKREGFWSCAIVRWAPDLDRRLFPVSLPPRYNHPQYLVPLDSGIAREAHAGAVKHLLRALNLNPCLTEALPPLLQLLLSVGNVNEAVDVVNKCCRATPNHMVLLSLKALLLEALTPKDNMMLLRCYKDIIRINPSSVSSVNALIQLHHSGHADTTSLMEAILTHLDVEAGCVLFWKKLAECFNVVHKYVQENKKDTEVLPIPTIQCSTAKSEENGEKPNIFSVVEGMLVDRRRWWGRKHFICNPPLFQTHGSSELLLWKAVCGGHIFGPEYAYSLLVELTFLQADKMLVLDRLRKHLKASIYNLLPHK